MCVHFFTRMIMNYMSDVRTKKNVRKKIQWEIINTQILNCLKFFVLEKFNEKIVSFVRDEKVCPFKLHLEFSS